MKLSKQERIGVLIIAVILILGLGIWLFIVPKVQTVKASDVTLNSKITERDEAFARAATKDQLKKDVLAAYEKGSDQANMFFEEMTAYQADQEFRAFLEQCDANVLVESLSVDEPDAYTLSPEYFEAEEVEYDLKTYVTQGVEPTEAELATEERWKAVKALLGKSQDVGSIAIEFSVSALTPEDLLAFCDEVNEYIKTENGKDTRKAVMLEGISVSYPLNEVVFDELMAEIEMEAAEKAIEELYKKYNMKVPVDEKQEQGEKEDEEKEETLNPEDYVYTLDTKIIFYSIERMQDPTAQLEAQEK